MRSPLSDPAALRKAIAWTMAGVLVVSLLAWFLTRDTLPRVVAFTAGDTGGLYHDFARAFGAAFEGATGRPVEVRDSLGSVENRERIARGEVPLGIVQGGTVPLDGLAVVAPLYPEVVHVVVRSGSGIGTIEELRGRRVAIGPAGSGMRESARKLLAHYELEGAIEEPEQPYFTVLLEDPTVEAAIVTTGVLNPDLRRVLASDGFVLLPVEDAAAMRVRDPYLRAATIPQGLFAESPRVPPHDVPTVATTALLVVRRDASDRLVGETLHAVYEEGLWLEIPTLIPAVEGRGWNQLPLHAVARQYFNPSDDVARVAAILESIAAFKELTFALVAGLYLVWDRWRRAKEQRREEEVREAKERLDEFLEQTLAIERAQMGSRSPHELQGMLDEVTRIKLHALEELAHEELRGDRSFLIFLTQCANLINKIQAKLALLAAPGGRSSDGDA